jgi:hypothetical protein
MHDHRPCHQLWPGLRCACALFRYIGPGCPGGAGPNSTPHRRGVWIGLHAEPRPDTSGARPPARSHNAHSLETVTIYYRWHPLFGLTLPLRRRQPDGNGERLLCQSPEGGLISFPSWMCSPECLQFSLGSPLISTHGLGQLRDLLDMWQASSNRLSDEEELNETISHATKRAVESGASRNTSDNRGLKRGTEGTNDRPGRVTSPRGSQRSGNTARRRGK